MSFDTLAYVSDIIANTKKTEPLSAKNGFSQAASILLPATAEYTLSEQLLTIVKDQKKPDASGYPLTQLAPHLIPIYRDIAKLAYDAAVGSMAANRDQIRFEPEDIQSSLKKVLYAGKLISCLVPALKEYEVNPDTTVLRLVNIFTEAISAPFNPTNYLPTSDTLLEITQARFWALYQREMPAISFQELENLASALEPAPKVA